MPKFFKIPEPKTLRDLTTGELAKEMVDGVVQPVVVSLRKLVLGSVLDHPMWSNSLDDSRMAADLVAAFDKAPNVGDHVELTGALFAKLVEAIKTPSYKVRTPHGDHTVQGYRNWTGAGVAQLVSMFDVILNATEIEGIAPKKSSKPSAS